MTCEDMEGALADLLGGELGEEDARRVEEHLAGCARCRAEVAALRGPLAELATLPQVDLAEAARRTSGLEVRRRVRRARTVLAALVAAATALLLGFVLGRRSAPPLRPPPPAPHAGEVHPGWVRAASRALHGGALPSVPPW